MTGRVLVLGGGVTGMQVAAALSGLRISAVLVEKGPVLGGHVRRLSRTFPLADDGGFGDGPAFVGRMASALPQAGVEVRLETTLSALEGSFPRFRATLADGTCLEVNAVVAATGYQPFDPTPLEEYGYHRYANVVTGLELEEMLGSAGALKRPSDQKPVSRLGIVFCVGSRSRRIGAPFCSRICCSYGTKQALMLLDRDPAASVTCFYIDIRTYDRGFEEMYHQAQERGVRYVRGRVSSCKELPNGDIAIRAENTLVQKLHAAEFDLVSLSTGMRPRPDGAQLAALLGIERDPEGFFSRPAWMQRPHDTTREGVFVAGCTTGARPIQDCMIEGSSVAARIAGLLAAHL